MTVRDAQAAAERSMWWAGFWTGMPVGFGAGWLILWSWVIFLS